MESIKEDNRERTIAAIATSATAGGIGIVRISGAEALYVAAEVFRPRSNRKSLQQQKGYQALFGRVFDSEGDIDDAIALVFRSPKSYTGENVVELSCHGGMPILQRVLRAVLKAGAEPAQPGEFTKRAFLNGKLSLTQAEAVNDLIQSQTQQGAKAALRLKDGALYQCIRVITDTLVSVSAQLQAWVDYPDEEIPELSPDQLKGHLLPVIQRLEGLLQRYDQGKMVLSGVNTCIIGKPNVGKSTLMNLLCGEEKSIVTEIPGTTRDIIENRIQIGSVILNLADTAGIRNTEDLVEKTGVARAWKRMKDSQLILAVFDISSPLETEDIELLESLKNTPCILILNKADLEHQVQAVRLWQAGFPLVVVSAKNGEGIQKLENEIQRLLHLGKLDPDAEILANERQKKCVERAVEQLRETVEALQSGVTLDAVTVCLDEALRSLLELNGERVNEKILDSIFSQFCVGK